MRRGRKARLESPPEQSAVVQVMAEAIASFLMINLVAPKHPVIVGAGMMGSLMGLSFESLLIDNDMLGAVLRTVRGIEVNEETHSYAVIEDAVHGEGHFLRQEQTLKLMRSEYDYPKLADRLTPDEWEEAGSLDIRQQASQGHFVIALPDVY